MCQKYIIALFFVLFYSTPHVFGQLKNFGSKSKFKPEPNYFFSVYGYYDVVREYGIGAQYQINNKYSLDLSVYKIYPYGYLHQKISQWDYYDFDGYGISIKPKFMFSAKNRLYVGLNLSFEQLWHGSVAVENYNGRGSQFYYDMLERKGYGNTIGISIGNKFTYKQLFIEPFISFGATIVKAKTIVHSSTYEYYNSADEPKYPLEYMSNGTYFQTNIGIKFGFSFKKSKKHIAIDQKFDQIYNPKLISLMNYFKTVDIKKIEKNKYLRTAYRRTKGLNRSILLRYKKNYADTTYFYKKVDELFQKIDSLIIKGNQ
jgi:hypothetical protein